MVANPTHFRIGPLADKSSILVGVVHASFAESMIRNHIFRCNTYFLNSSGKGV